MKNIRKIKKSNKGITLVALVITVIILIILAGITIAGLTGEKGLIKEAKTAKELTELAGLEEQIDLAIIKAEQKHRNPTINDVITELINNKVISDESKVNKETGAVHTALGYLIEGKLDDYIGKTSTGDGDTTGNNTTGGNTSGGGDVPNPPTLTLPSTDNTKPFLPEGSEIIGNSLETGVIIKDSNENEWVWIEVPKSIYRGTTTSTDYTDIETTLQTYAKDYRESGYVDKFYSTAQHGFTNATEYNNHKNSMLKSVYENGGFYIGRYETGTKTARFSSSATLTTPIIKRDVYPYNFVTCSQSQTLSEQLSTGGKTGSLMFGIQWDLVFEFLKTKGLLNGTISEWGNSQDASFDITRGQYTNTPDVPNSWQDASSYTKNKGISVLLTTGASDRNSVLGIYDLVGNLTEVTLEYTGQSTYPCAYRGNGYYRGSVVYPAYAHTYDSTTASSKIEGFRSTLW
ncbi:MAG: hypothetical protein HFJ36_02540 [Clostridia bacterium]|nr:hypothetical protein [Clostridia bacterium]